MKAIHYSGAVRTNVRLGKYMTAYPVSNGKHAPWAIKASSGHYIAYLEWYAPWRQYVMNAESTAVFSHDCLTAVAGFCKRLTASAKDPTRLTDEGVNSGSCNDGELGRERE
jgi:hypothetical protein